MQRIELSEDDAGASRSLHPGDELRVRLGENPTTGYRWQLVQSGSGRLDPAADAFEPASPSAASAAPGAAGHRVVLFVAAEPGSVRLEAIERRPWDAEAAARQRLEFVLEIR